MKIWIHRLGSIKIAAVLLVTVLVAMAAGTIVEAARGTETAARTVYYALWFRALLGLFAANVLFSIADLWPWGRQRIGYLLTHGSMVIILLGALVTDRAKQEGQLALWEGETGDSFEAGPAPGAGAAAARLSLPFSVRLDAFEIDYYQGTHRPAMFRSRVTVSDPKTARPFPAVIEMNRELAYGGYRFFQSSYQETAQGKQSVLLVSRDPGQPIVFAGYVLLMAGMGTVLATRVAQRRALARQVASQPARRASRRIAAAAMILAAACVAPIRASEAAAGDPALLPLLRRVPVQHDGRVMPLDTLARETVWKVAGRAGVGGIDPVDLVLAWTFEPRAWIDRPMLPLHADLAAAVGLPEGKTVASFQDLAQNQNLMSLLQQAQAAEQQERPIAGLQREAQGVGERLALLQGFFEGSALRIVPGPRPGDTWSPATDLHGPSDLATRAASGPVSALAASAVFGWELAYNAWRPSRLAWILLAIALAGMIAGLRRERRALDVVSGLGVAAGFAAMTWGLAARWVAAGRIPASNMYESLLFLGWGVGLFAVVALVFLRNRLVLLNATAMAALTMALVDLLPIDPFIHPMPPVLSGTPWLAIHVPIIMISYSVLAIGVLVAHMQIGVVIFAPARRDLAFKMGDLLYWYIHIGSFLLIAGILTGSIWAASSWGRYWGWDPKEVWSLVAFLAYLAILHGRFDRLIGAFGVAALSIVAFWTILMTYIGVNFILSSGMHSYGFGGAGVVRSMLIIAALEGLFLFIGFMSQVAAARTLRAPASSGQA